MPLEFRVRWQRDGRQPTTRIYQGWNAACRKARGIQALDDIKADTVKFAEMPDLVGPPELQVRHWNPVLITRDLRRDSPARPRCVRYRNGSGRCVSACGCRGNACCRVVVAHCTVKSSPARSGVEMVSATQSRGTR